jgi:prevent-host-death family protein
VCLTRDTIFSVTDVSIRDLRNHGGDIVDRVTQCEQVTITRAGKAVAELHPLPRPSLSAAALLARWHLLPTLDPGALRADIDQLIDPRM